MSRGCFAGRRPVSPISPDVQMNFHTTRTPHSLVLTNSFIALTVLQVYSYPQLTRLPAQGECGKARRSMQERADPSQLFRVRSNCKADRVGPDEGASRKGDACAPTEHALAARHPEPPGTQWLDAIGSCPSLGCYWSSPGRVSPGIDSAHSAMRSFKESCSSGRCGRS